MVAPLPSGCLPCTGRRVRTSRLEASLSRPGTAQALQAASSGLEATPGSRPLMSLAHLGAAAAQQQHYYDGDEASSAFAGGRGTMAIMSGARAVGGRSQPKKQRHLSS